MTSHRITAHRAAPEEIRRTTANGSDQFVLACTARRDASDVTFRQIELYERQNSALRKELAWAESHSRTRTARYIRSRIFIVGCVTATVLAFLGWSLLGIQGKALRVAWVFAWQTQMNPKIRRIDGGAWLIRDMPQTLVDSIVRVLNDEALPSPFR